MKNKFTKAYLEQFSHTSYTAKELEIFYKKHEKDLLEFYKKRNNFEELVELEISKTRVATEKIECMAMVWVHEYDEFDYVEEDDETYPDGYEEYQEILKLGSYINVGEEYHYYFGYQACTGELGEYTANPKTHEYCLENDIFINYCD